MTEAIAQRCNEGKRESKRERTSASHSSHDSKLPVNGALVVVVVAHTHRVLPSPPPLAAPQRPQRPGPTSQDSLAAITLTA